MNKNIEGNFYTPSFHYATYECISKGNCVWKSIKLTITRKRPWDKVATIVVSSGTVGNWCTLVRPICVEHSGTTLRRYCWRQLHNHSNVSWQCLSHQWRSVLKFKVSVFFFLSEDDSCPTGARRQHWKLWLIAKQMLLTCWKDVERLRSCFSPASFSSARFSPVIAGRNATTVNPNDARMWKNHKFIPKSTRIYKQL